MPDETPAQAATMTDPIKLARDALERLADLYEAEFDPEVIARPKWVTDALAALDAIPQPATVPADAELDALQERLVNPRQWSLKGDARRAADALSALRTRLAEVEGALRWAHDTLWELNPSNYDHDDVCKINDASVEVILGIAPLIGETHGKTPEWWAAHRKLKEGK